MPHARRNDMPHYIWHLTHRCYEKEFLLKFARDRRCWTEWLFEAKKQYGLQVLNYIVTSNHIHLLVSDSGAEGVISKSMKLIAARTGREYNARKNRIGSFWEDRYHATAIQTDQHFLKCMLYIDLNMVRAGVVSHPSEWEYCGFNEIQNPKKRYRLIDYDQLLTLLNMDTKENLQKAYCRWVEDAIEKQGKIYEGKWSQSIAVGDNTFIENIMKELGPKARYRRAMGEGTEFQLKEDKTPYGHDSDIENYDSTAKNTYVWNDVK